MTNNSKHGQNHGWMSFYQNFIWRLVKKTDSCTGSLVYCHYGMESIGTYHSFRLTSDPEFKESNKTFSANIKELKRQGQGGVDHYPPIEKEDLVKLYDYFDLDNNIKLQEKVFFDIVLYFGRRGRENIQNLKISDFAATTDTTGSIYIFLAHDELTKNHQEDSNTSDGRMFSILDDEMCPVKSYMKYKRALNPKCNRLFQRPSRNSNSLQWYDAIPLGHNSIGNMMPKMSESAGLSEIHQSLTKGNNRAFVRQYWEIF